MYDYIIAGAGLAGLSLAYRLNNSPLKDKKILLIDKDKKKSNDRTWSFWIKQQSIFEDVIHKSWERIDFKSPAFSQNILLPPYRYCSIKGINFYKYILQDLEQNSNIEWVFGEAKNIQSEEGFASIEVNQNTYQGRYLFDSFYTFPTAQKKGYHYFKQHFKGRTIRTKAPVFDEKTVTFMDFRIAQRGETRFFYILPTSPYQALVEFTVFSETLLEQSIYDLELDAYIRNYLKIEQYELIEEEFGVIPMVDLPKARHTPQSRVVSIGTKSGKAKASSGYAFSNIQKESDLIFKNLLNKRHPTQGKEKHAQFELYDSLLLEVIKNSNYEARDIFAALFKKHKVGKVLRFLDEETNFFEDLSIMASVRPFPFIKAFFKVMQARIVA